MFIYVMRYNVIYTLNYEMTFNALYFGFGYGFAKKGSPEHSVYGSLFSLCLA